MNEYIPTAWERAMMVYTNAVIDLAHEMNKARRERLQWRANYALRVAASTDNPFPGWKLPRYQEPCTRCRGRMVVTERGCLYPCEECCTIDGIEKE